MRTKEEIKAELSLLYEQRNAVAMRIKEAEQELADCLAKFRVGQRVIESIGKNKAEYEISSVRHWFNDHVEYNGRKVLKSGALHKNTKRLYGDIEAKPDTPSESA